MLELQAYAIMPGPLNSIKELGIQRLGPHPVGVTRSCPVSAVQLETMCRGRGEQEAQGCGGGQGSYNECLAGFQTTRT